MFFMEYRVNIEDLKAVQGARILENGESVMIHLSLDMSLHKSILRYPVCINGFLILFCSSGMMKFRSNMFDFEVTANTMFVAASTVLEFSEVENCDIYLMSFSTRFAEEMNLNLQLAMPLIMSLQRRSEIIRLPENYSDRVGAAFSFFYSEHLNSSDDLFKSMSIKHIYSSFVYKVFSLIHKCSGSGNFTDFDNDYSRHTCYFERLLDLLSKHFIEERSVEFYADKIGLTPKHLSKIIKEFTGKTVHQWIDNFVVVEIKNMLRNTNFSIQEISYKLNFPNPSFMGQYFKRITGITPGEYKQNFF